MLIYPKSQGLKGYHVTMEMTKTDIFDRGFNTMIYFLRPVLLTNFKYRGRQDGVFCKTFFLETMVISLVHHIIRSMF